MKTLISCLGALSLALIATPILAQKTQLSPDQASTAQNAEAGYVSAMRSDLKHLATAEEAYFVDHSAYYSGTVSAANPLFGFSPSRGVTINVTAPAGAPMWSAVATHARSQTKCSYSLPDPIDCVSLTATPGPSAVADGDSATISPSVSGRGKLESGPSTFRMPALAAWRWVRSKFFPVVTET
jgi:hypothetical protein